jgi:transposase
MVELLREERDVTIVRKPEQLIFTDESGLSAKMAICEAGAPKGQRCRAAVPHGHWKTITFVAGLTGQGFVAPMLLDGPMDGECFLAWIEQMLVSALHPSDVVVMDNLPAHKVAGVKQAIEACGAVLLYLPPYSPDLNPIENAFAKLKGACAQSGRANLRSPRSRSRPAKVQPAPLRKLFRPRRIWAPINGNML